MDAITYLVKKHREMEDLLDELEEARGSDRRGELLRDVTAELARHMAIEERVLFPAIREELAPANPELFSADVLEALEEHHVLKLLLDELGDMDPSDERFPAKAEVLSETVEHHHDEEEDDLFPALRERWNADRLEELGTELREAEAVAPTRPHPKLPDEGRFVALAQRFAASIDAARDRVRDAAGDLRG